ncbi:DUF2207 domain-containing protein [Patescibacteria group bacterium]|nr:DUF2207 domain-containing protein [Patescibacteria group bacterium]MCL5091929.1 DUF2207 domain-containing protein [Patescibacteria group bacterium]
MKKIIVLATAALVLAFPRASFAEQIDRFAVKITVKQDATVAVSETIVYNFGSASKHGIVRNIPTVKTNQDGKRYQLQISHISVVDTTGQDYRWQESADVAGIQLKIGRADQVVSGVHTYVINYDVTGALSYFSDHDELYWNVTGNRWLVPIVTSSATVRLPDQVTASRVKTGCYTGVAGSRTSNCQATVSGNQIMFQSGKSLGPSEGWTVVVGFPTRTVAVVTPVPVVSWWEGWVGKLLAIIIALMALFWYVVYPLWLPIKWYWFGRDPQVATGSVKAWYDPPKDPSGRPLSPAETGTVIDESVDLRDLIGTIVDLARRGFLKIVEKKKGDFSLVKQRDWDTDHSVLGFEKQLLEGLFADDSEVRLKNLKFYATAEAVKKQIYTDLVKHGTFPSDPRRLRTFYLVIGGLALISFNFFLAIMVLIFGRVMFRKTKQGKEQANVARSLYNFLSSQSRQLKFQADRQMFFEKLLPYAVVFGVEKVWAKRFVGLNLAPPDWYQGYDQQSFTTTYFVASLNNSFSHLAAAARPPSTTVSRSGFSSGFSGGFSGGGGGGGGGGSW